MQVINMQLKQNFLNLKVRAYNQLIVLEYYIYNFGILLTLLVSRLEKPGRIYHRNLIHSRWFNGQYRMECHKNEFLIMDKYF